jgi:hypothetical protein
MLSVCGAAPISSEKYRSAIFERANHLQRDLHHQFLEVFVFPQGFFGVDTAPNAVEYQAA